MRHSTKQSAGLDWLLDELVQRVPAARQAVVLSADGLLLGASAELDRSDAEHLCALAAGFSSLARGASRHVDGGPVRQTVVEMEAAYLFVTAAGQGACLAVRERRRRGHRAGRVRDGDAGHPGRGEPRRAGPIGGGCRRCGLSRPGRSTSGWTATAGPVVRPYTLTGGRVRSAVDDFDLVAFVLAGSDVDAASHRHLQPEHRRLVALARRPVSVAELAAELDLAVGVVRVLLGDLLARGPGRGARAAGRRHPSRRRHPQGGGQWTPCALTRRAPAPASRWH